MKKKAKRVIIILALLIVAFFILEHIILVHFTKTALKKVVGLDTHMNRIIVNPITGAITVRGLKIFNPPGFKEQILARVPRITLDFKAKTLFQEGTFFDGIWVHLEELIIIKNKEDVVNITQIKAFTPQEKPAKTLPFLSDKYVLEVEKVKYIDYAKDKNSRVKEIDLNIKEEYKNVKDPSNIARAIVFKVFFNSQIGSIGINIQKIQNGLAKLAAENKKLADELEKLRQKQIEKAKEVAEAVEVQAEKVKEAVKEQIEKTKEDVKQKAENVKETIDKAQEVIKEKVTEIKEKSK